VGHADLDPLAADHDRFAGGSPPCPPSGDARQAVN
jgi:hypothetical protein